MSKKNIYILLTFLYILFTGQIGKASVSVNNQEIKDTTYEKVILIEFLKKDRNNIIIEAGDKISFNLNNNSSISGIIGKITTNETIVIIDENGIIKDKISLKQINSIYKGGNLYEIGDKYVFKIGERINIEKNNRWRKILTTVGIILITPIVIAAGLAIWWNSG